MSTDPRAAIAAADTALGIEFGSTRIKAVLIGPDHEVLATGGHGWENHLEGGLWSYTLDEVVPACKAPTPPWWLTCASATTSPPRPTARSASLR